jgi:hypothetical protein
MIRIKQKQSIRAYQIPTFGMRELKEGELVKEDSKLGKALLVYFPDICKIEEDVLENVDDTDKDILLVEDPIEEATSEEFVLQDDEKVEEKVEVADVKVEETEVSEKPKSKRGRKPSK